MGSITSLEIQMMLRGFIPVIMIVAAGILVGRWDASRHQATLEKLIHYLFLPCLVFSSIHKHPFVFKEVVQINTAVTVMVCLLTILSLLAMRRESGHGRVGLLAAIFMSSGTLLLPLAYLLFGNEGLAKAIYFHLCIMLLYHTLGAYLTEGKPAIKEFFKVPSLYLAILGAAAAASPFSVPDNLQEFFWLSEKGIDLTGMGALPLLLISFGYPLGLLKRSNMGKGLRGGAVRLLAGPLTALLLIYVYRASGWLGMERGYDVLDFIDRRTTEAVLALGAAMPASHYALHLDPDEGIRAGDEEAGTVLVTALGGIVTVAAVLLLIDVVIFVD
jgi:predicted permease